MSHYWSAPANQRPVLSLSDQSEASIYEKRAGDTLGLSETSPSRPLPGCLYTTQTPDRIFGNACNINTIYNISDGDLNPSHHQADEYYRNTGDPRQETVRIQFARSMIILILLWSVAWVTIYAGLMR